MNKPNEDRSPEDMGVFEEDAISLDEVQEALDSMEVIHAK